VGEGKSRGAAAEPIALRGIHEAFISFFRRATGGVSPLDVLDAGAGEGAFTRRLLEAGHRVSACDLSPGVFRMGGVPFRQADITRRLPYEDRSFDAVVAVEVLEHVFGHEGFFAECRRILRPGGKLLLSTPNILSLKSRARFLLTGFFYSMHPLDPGDRSGLQHVAFLTLDQFRYLGSRHGLALVSYTFDKRQRSSAALLFLWPLLWAYSRAVGTDFRVHNRLDLLLGRILFLEFEKTTEPLSQNREGSGRP